MCLLLSLGDAMKLTKSKVEDDSIIPEKGTALIWDSDLTGFGLRVTEKGVRSYIVQARVNGRTRRVTLGRHGVLTAEQARKRAKSVLGQMTEGVDPVAQRRRAKAVSVTLRDVVEDYIKNRRRKSDGRPLTDRTKADIRRHLKTNFTDWADRPIADLSRDAVRKRYTEIGSRSHAQANQAMRVLSGLVNYARGIYRDSEGQPVILDNPVEVVRDTSIQYADRERDTRVPLEKIGQFYSALEATRCDAEVSLSKRIKVSAAVVLMLTGLRKSDVVERRWSEVDLDEGALAVADSKHREPRLFPIAEQVVDVLRDLEDIRSGPWVFPDETTKRYVDDLRPGMRPAVNAIGQHVAPHDLRRTFTDVADEAEVDPLVAELLSNRKGPAYSMLRTRNKHYASKDLTRFRDKTQAIADYFDRKRAVFEADNVSSMEGAR